MHLLQIIFSPSLFGPKRIVYVQDVDDNVVFIGVNLVNFHTRGSVVGF